MNYIDIYKRLYETSIQAGVVAQMLQKDILNEGKKVEKLEDEDARHLAMREAKTKADEIVQEMLLTSLLADYKDEISVDAEEETKSILLFTNPKFQTSLVIDPIDGTFDYIQQKDTYSICSAIFHEGELNVALVYFPARAQLYGYALGHGVMYYQNPQYLHYDEGEDRNGCSKAGVSKAVYKNSRLEDTCVSALKESGYHVVDDAQDALGCPEAILKCMCGRGLAYISHTRNIRDILLGAILSKMEDAHAYDRDGKEVVWEACGRQPLVVFSRYELDSTFFACLQLK